MEAYWLEFDESLRGRDLRSPARPAVLDAKQSAKYYGYRGVRASWLGQPYYRIRLGVYAPEILVTDAWSRLAPEELPDRPELREVRTWTKRELYAEAENNIWPLERRHKVGRRIRNKHDAKWMQRQMERRGKQKSRWRAGELRDGDHVREMDFDQTDWENPDEWPLMIGMEGNVIDHHHVQAHGELYDETIEWRDGNGACVEQTSGEDLVDWCVSASCLVGAVLDSESDFDMLSELDFDTVSVDWSDDGC